MRVLVVEDSRSLADVLVEGLRDQGMAVDAAHDGLEAAAKLEVNAYNVVVLDRDLPGIHGDTLCQMITERDDRVMVLMLTAASAPGERVSGLGLGADDYLAKPFEVTELEARIRALARRTGSAKRAQLELGPLHFDQNTKVFSLANVPLHVSPREHSLLEKLLRNAGMTVSKASLLESLYGFDDDVDLSAIELYVHRLRKKLEGSEVTIVTLRGLGYLLRLADK